MEAWRQGSLEKRKHVSLRFFEESDWISGCKISVAMSGQARCGDRIKDYVQQAPGSLPRNNPGSPVDLDAGILRMQGIVAHDQISGMFGGPGLLAAVVARIVGVILLARKGYSKPQAYACGT